MRVKLRTFLFSTALALVAGCQLPSKVRIIIPAGYRGFIGIFYERGATPLPTSAGWTAVEIPPSGALFTSTRFQSRYGKTEFFERVNGALIPLRANFAGSIPTTIPGNERIVAGGAVHSGFGPPIETYFIGDAADRAKLDWQSSKRWISATLAEAEAKSL